MSHEPDLHNLSLFLSAVSEVVAAHPWRSAAVIILVAVYARRLARRMARFGSPDNVADVAALTWGIFWLALIVFGSLGRAEFLTLEEAVICVVAMVAFSAVFFVYVQRKGVSMKDSKIRLRDIAILIFILILGRKALPKIINRAKEILTTWE